MREQVLRALADTFESIQKERVRANNKLQAIFRGIDEGDPLREKVYGQIAKLEELEEELEKMMVEELKSIPVWQAFLKHVKGVGPRLAVRLLALPLDPQKHLSSWYAYFGLTPAYWLAECEEGHKVMLPKERGNCPVCGKALIKLEKIEGQAPRIKLEKIEGQAPRRKKGYRPFWNTKARKVYFMIAEQFMRVGGFYKEVYKRAKARQPADIRPIIADSRARRKAFKLFLAHLHECMRELAGLEKERHYVFEYLNHDEKDYLSWREVVNIEKALRNGGEKE